MFLARSGDGAPFEDRRVAKIPPSGHLELRNAAFNLNFVRKTHG
jgi:hypothetical protein